MRRHLIMIFLATTAMFLTSCSSSDKKSGKQSEQETEQTLALDESPIYTELTKVPLPCSKDSLYYAWKEIGVIDVAKKKSLDYRQHTPTLFISSLVAWRGALRSHLHLCQGVASPHHICGSP